jgi:putative ATPase
VGSHHREPKARRFYKPTTRGFERERAERYEAIQRQLADKPREPGEEG